ncbi:hypothetical protein E4U42_003011 [Claviceps africana]|uniref:Uncharacterized protein n=1 Tax=Claviceps africana TaxID=83212 RepID=A0A8K0JDF7_9HYPO|nr:hypothetical protein E4U42_003011 [Claviceps africana]
MAPKYKLLPKDEEEQSPQEDGRHEDSSLRGKCPKIDHQPTHPPKGWKPSLSTCKDVMLIVFAALGVVSLLRSPVPAPDMAACATPTPVANPPASCSCGNSTAQARALGCKYDSLAAAWLPPHCRDDDLTAEFERSGPGRDGRWTYWRDPAHTHEIGLDELAEMGDNRTFRFYMTRRWHVVHCMFYWRKEHRARFNGKRVEPRSDNEGHINHCSKVILGRNYSTVAGVELNTDR